jgi:hypothetical protein
MLSITRVSEMPSKVISSRLEGSQRWQCGGGSRATNQQGLTATLTLPPPFLILCGAGDGADKSPKLEFVYGIWNGITCEAERVADDGSSPHPSEAEPRTAPTF